LRTEMDIADYLWRAPAGAGRYDSSVRGRLEWPLHFRRLHGCVAGRLKP
jgi:hypothetical protein